MTLNLFHQPPILPDGNFSLSMRFDDHFTMDGFYDFGMDTFEKAGPHDCEDDVLDLLPPDPFGMNMDATFTAITDFLDLFGKDASFIWNTSMKCHMCFREEPFGEPHEALNYVLGYLGVKELVTVERVCKSLNSTVKEDPLLWRKICIESENIDDDALFEITRRAQGNLRHLSLFKCSRVTNDGLERVLEMNPRIEKLSVPECTGLSVDGIVKNLKKLQESDVFGLKYIRMGGRYDVTREHFENLQKLFHVEDFGQTKACKPRIYRGRLLPILHDEDDDKIIDIEQCPRCENIRLIFDCSVCHMTDSSMEKCRACITCITRCCQCGRCLNDGYIEPFDLQELCLYCFAQQPERHVVSELARGLS